MMHVPVIIASLVATFAHHASAHGIVTKIIVGGTSTYQGYDPNFQYMPTPPPTIGWASPPTQDRGPVDGTKLDSPDVICQRNATPATTAATVAAGEVVSLQWTVWPDSHHGPMIDYLAACPGADCSNVDKTALEFFKIDGVGMVDTAATPPNFGDDQMIKNNNTWSVKIPETLKAGNYVLRHETIALHQAQGVGGAQLYPQCVNIQVTGGGSDVPAGVLGTALYKETDPGIQFNIYQKFTSTNQYTVPGPPLIAAAASATTMAGAAAAPSGNSKAETDSVKDVANAGEATEIGNALDNAQGMVSDKCSAYLNAVKRGEKHAREFRAHCVS